MKEYRLAQRAGRLSWTLEQVLSVPIEASALAEQLGWRGQKGFEALMAAPAETVRDFLFIAHTEREIVAENKDGQ